MYVRWIPYAYLNFCEKREKRETPCKLRECYVVPVYARFGMFRYTGYGRVRVGASTIGNPYVSIVPKYTKKHNWRQTDDENFI